MESKKPDEKINIKLLPETKSGQTRYKYGAKLKLSDADAKTIIEDIDNEISEIKAIRSKQGLAEQWQEDRDQYDGVVEYKDFPWRNSSNLHIHITKMTVDIMKVKAKAQMFVKPMMLLKPYPGQTGDENLYNNIKRKEEYLDTKIREEMEIENILDPVLEDAINLGTGILKSQYIRQIETVTDAEVYAPEDITKFEDTFKAQKTTETYKANHALLKAGKTIEVYSEQDELIKDGPELSYVKLDDLYLRPDIPDINKHRVIAEKIKMQWYDIQAFANSGFFDKGIIDELKKKHEKDYNKIEYIGWETNYLWDYDNTGKPKRCIITYLEDTKRVLRAIAFPFIHRQPNYDFYYIKRSPDSIYGKGLAKSLAHTNRALNNCWNQVIDSGTIRNAPQYKAKKDVLDPTTKEIGPAVIWWVEGNINDIEVLYAGGNPVEMTNLISKLERYAEYITGVTAYMSGRESPLDPNAPMGKAYMLLKESNLRVNEAIKQLHNSNKNLFFKIDKLLYQYIAGEKLTYGFTGTEKYEPLEISKSVMGIRVQYIPQLSDITVNKELEAQEDMRFAVFLLAQPPIQQNPIAYKAIIELLVRNKGGQWEKSMDKLGLTQPKAKPGGATPGAMGLPQMPGISQIPGIPQIPGMPGTMAPNTGAPTNIPAEMIPK